MWDNAAYQREYREMNPERVRQWNRNRQAKKGPGETPEQRAERYRRHAEFMRQWHRARRAPEQWAEGGPQ